MMRLPVLSRLARRHPIVLPFLAEAAEGESTPPLPDTMVINKLGELVLEHLLQRPYWNNIGTYCSPALHPAGLLIAAGPMFDRVNRQLEATRLERDPVDRAEEMFAIAMHCGELAASAHEALPLQVFQLNWLSFAVAAAGLPQAALALHDLLLAWQVPPLAASAVLLPGIRYLAEHLDDQGERWEDVQAWIKASRAGDEAASQHLASIPAGLLCVLELARLVVSDPDAHLRRDVVDFVRQARRWGDQGMALLAEAGKPWADRAGLQMCLDRLAQWSEASHEQPLPGYFGFPFAHALPGIRVHEKLTGLYLSGEPSPFFQDERFQFEALLRAAIEPLSEFLASDPELLQAVEAAGGKRADFYQLGEQYYDQLDALRAAAPEGSWSEERSLLFLRALSCRALAIVRHGCFRSAEDLHAALERYAREEEQDPWVSAATALLLFAPLASVIEEALSIESDGHTLRVAAWIDLYRHPDPLRQDVGRLQLQRLRFACVKVCQLVEDGREMLVALAGAEGQVALLIRLGDLVEDMTALLEVPEIGVILGDEGSSARSYMEQAQRIYRRTGESLADKKSPCKPVGTTQPQVAPASPGAASPLPCPATAATLVSIVQGKVLDTPADIKYLKEQWSQSKAETLKKGVELLPARLAQVGQLRDEFPWFQEIIDFIETWLLRNEALGVQCCRLPPMLLVGGVGCGKTHFCRRLAETLGLPFQLLAAGGSSDNRQLAGTARGWGTAFPSLPVDFMCGSGVGNGLVIVDEVDKESPDRRNGRLTDTLLQLLEPANSRHFNDPFIGSAVDCSHLQWMLTANTLKGVHEALLSRVRMFVVQQPSREHFPGIAQQIRMGFAKEHQVDHRLLPALDGDDLEMIRKLCKSVRQVRQVTEWLLTRRIVEEKKLALAH